ncbi:MAG: hypothetical protein AAFR58_09345 [Cyanobacteria bacterium J06627_28]
MLVILIEGQLLTPATVCQSCPMASQSGEPRWKRGKLGCGRPVQAKAAIASQQYECTMGFRIAEVTE